MTLDLAHKQECLGQVQQLATDIAYCHYTSYAAILTSDKDVPVVSNEPYGFE